MLGASVWKKVLGWVSLPTGAPLGNLGKGVHLPGTLRISYGALLGEPGGGVPLLGTLWVMKGRLWGQASLFLEK